MALRFRSTKAPACLSVSLYSPIGHWSNITTGNLDLICHRQINARPLCQFPKREREKANEKERKEGTRGVVCETETEICILMVLMCASR